MTDIPDLFFDNVKEALENIYDFPALQAHPFAQQLNQQNPDSRDNPAHQVRRLLIDAIEKLNPGDHEGVRNGTNRIYNLLHLHYVGGMTIQEVALELGISVRQAYRDLKKGQDSVSSVLWYKLKPSEDEVEPRTMDKLSTVESEMIQVEGNVATVNITVLIESLANALNRLAEQFNVSIDLDLSPDVMVSTNPTLARQALMNLISQLIQHTQSNIQLSLTEEEKYIVLQIGYPELIDNESLSSVFKQFAQQLGWKIEQKDSFIQVMINRVDTTILLIDDNKGLADLMKRYLSDASYQVVAAHSGHDGLQLAQNIAPDVIIMDIMMPQMDGWELLQRLQTFQDTKNIPVIVCSVINDPQLAFSLGASTFIAKPVDKDKLFQALIELDL